MTCKAINTSNQCFDIILGMEIMIVRSPQTLSLPQSLGEKKNQKRYRNRGSKELDPLQPTCRNKDAVPQNFLGLS